MQLLFQSVTEWQILLADCANASNAPPENTDKRIARACTWSISNRNETLVFNIFSLRCRILAEWSINEFKKYRTALMRLQNYRKTIAIFLGLLLSKFDVEFAGQRSRVVCGSDCSGFLG